MAAPVNPTWPQGSVGFYQLLIDMVTIASNLSLPDATSGATGVFGSTTATVMIACAEKQRDLY